ncbi:MAG: hypothetical protein E5W91_32030 [Mesorhizobium sp.]|uniref:hypothetical protein n=1 Tax=Mesorhizobium sp. TaxID=1871066 RepID=UPI0011FFB27D|nr:hypothetical protein [Mesorhizobium sp.]TIS53194.1 MAG: hypothetical protein E5W91_32030 [Mesorhizobium sp.]
MASIPTDWGLPDWRDPIAYGNVSVWSYYRWRWEFTRRRDDIRRTFLEHADETHKSLMAAPNYSDMEAKDGKTPNDPGFWAMTPLQPKFGMTGIPNPSISDQPMLERVFVNEHEEVYEGRGKDYLNFEEWTSIFLPESTVAIVFDTTRSFAPQIKAAQATLKRYGDPRQRRKHPRVWLAYLRVLDAREASASWSVIAKVVLNKNIRDQESAPQAAKETWDQARALMFSWAD